MNNSGYQPTDDIITPPPDRGSSIEDPKRKIDITLRITKAIKHKPEITLDDLEEDIKKEL